MNGNMIIVGATRTQHTQDDDDDDGEKAAARFLVAGERSAKCARRHNRAATSGLRRASVYSLRSLQPKLLSLSLSQSRMRCVIVA